jgi:trk system potassium uptake protein TrkA
MKVPETLDCKTLSEINTRAKFGCSIVAIHRDGKVIVAPTAMDQLRAGDIMVIIGANGNIDRFESEAVNVD